MHTAGSRVDITLPNTVPLLELTPAVAALCGLEGEDARPPAWTFARVGRPPLDLTTTLAEAQVLDGEVLHLVDASAWESPHVVTFDDPVASAAVADGERPASALAGPGVMVFAAALLVMGAAVAAWVPALRASAGPALLAATVTLLALAYLLPAGAARVPPKVALTCGAWAMAPVAGWSLTAHLPHARFAGAAIALLVTVLAATPLMPRTAPGLTVFAGALTLSSVAVALGLGAAQASAISVVVATLALRTGPRLLGRQLSRRAALEPGRVEAQTRSSRTFLVSGTYGCTAAAVVASCVLLVTGDPAFAIALVAVTGCSLALRAATFRYAREAAPTAVGAGITVIAAVLALTVVLVAHGLPGAAVVIPLVAGVAVAALSTVRRRSRDGLRHVTTGWALIDGATAPVLLALLGVFDGLSNLLGGMFG
ncbi:type VII secretion integral membrane protein EccD [Actinoallomurus oryzae]|uniref:Type VII secretion integral membrane protein EccD n=1 Tax=Actinoallomurus oryzae TaxID=502180 RepID=A0ABP8Q649_9ACTN